MMKKILIIVVILGLLASLFACSSNKKSSAEFEEWTKDIPGKLLGNEDYVLYSLFEDPKAAGFDMDVEGLTFTTLEEYEEGVQEAKQMLKELRTYDYKDLNEDQKITYDLLEDSLNQVVEAKDDYYLTTNYFDVGNGVQASLVLNLYFMDIQNEDALIAMLNVMESCEKKFVEYVEFEKERQELGYGMSKTYMDEVLEQVHTFNSMDHHYLLDKFYTSIKDADFLDENKKQVYLKEVQDIYDTKFIPAFKQLEKDLKTVEIKTEDEDASLADYEGGKEYYERLIYENTGFYSVEEFDVYLGKAEDRITTRMYSLIREFPELMDTDFSLTPDATYTHATTVEDTLAFLEGKVNNSGHFPEVKDIEYVMDVIPKELQEIYKAAAAYYIGPFDNLNAKEQMILNGEFTQSDYTTLAHEGFPGHMYQYRYFKTTDHNLLRDVLANGGYSEGWAVYASKLMNLYAVDNGLCAFMGINEDLTYLYLMRMDIMIHYDNASREEVYKYLRENFGIEDEESLQEVYEQTLEDPAIFVPYYGYYFRLLDLKDKAYKAWEEEYSEYKFHKAILDLGALPYNLLEEYLKEQF